MSRPPAARREFSHPALWTAGLLVAAGAMGWTFFHWLEVGMRHGRDAGPVTFAPATPAKPVDHQALLGDRSPAVIERGQQLYLRNCAACHGADGAQNATGSNPAPRNLQTEAAKAEWGGGPYGFYLTLTKGLAGMPAFPALEAADRYAIVHYVRETWQKGKPTYVEDAAAVVAQIPAANAAVAAGPRTPPHLVPQHQRLHPLMAVAARDAAAEVAAARAWIAKAAGAAEPAERRLLDRAAAAGEARPGWLLALRAAAESGDRSRAAAVLIAPDSGDPAFALAPAASIDACAAVLVAAAARKA